MTDNRTPPFFRITARQSSTGSKARRGIVNLGRFELETPVFMPVGTAGAIKAVRPYDLETMGYQMILCNTYHLWMRPGHEVVSSMGGLHRFIGWPAGILTDSGGYQIFSLKGLTRIDDEGVTFSSHLDGSRHLLTPEKAVGIQKALGSDIIMCLDECIAFPAEETMVRLARERTTRWAKRCFQTWKEVGGGALFGIVQGGMVTEERLRSLEEIVEIGFPGLAIGGLSVGEPRDLMYSTLETLAPHMPEELPHYLMGVGEPVDILYAVDCGIDMFDCVLPTRLGRHGSLYTPEGRINIVRKEYATDDRPVWPGCDCLLCRKFSRGYLRHLLKAREVLGLTLGSLHNLRFFSRFMADIRDAISNGIFDTFRDNFLEKYRG
ncbi:MAG: tRNA guanosine(34) transglycosylase Tgt [bacterium]|jgi:queuine tRNA-ribosyltransferase|nr:tRNA guanosine(34) transglycosylase Tgt [bacterium]